ncbi:MAG: hypothetical protein WBD41_00505 [Rhodococcus sp. (in: high G+C Gram-positive bacteria)]|jgi:hypothetical protein
MTTTHPTNNGPGFSGPDHPTTGPGRSAFLRPLCGAERGYNTAGDVLVNRTADGVDLNLIWQEAQQALALANAERTSLASLISYPTTSVADPVAQAVGGDHFEESSEMGEPTGIRSGAAPLLMGYNFKDFDLAARLTWKFLRDAPAEQVRDIINRALEADNRLVTGSLIRQIFTNATGFNEFQHPVRPLYTGLDGSVPPPFAGRTFTSSASHMLASGNSAIDPGDLQDAISAVTSKGYGINRGSQLIILCHPHEAEIISTFRRGVQTNGIESRHDYVPSVTAPPWLSDESIVGVQPPGEFNGLPVAGQWGPAWIVPTYYLPDSGYFACVASGGRNNALNPVAFRQHANVAYQGLRQIPGRDQRYPLQDSFFTRAFGTGVRHRGAACVVQITAGSVYTPPVWQWT